MIRSTFLFNSSMPKSVGVTFAPGRHDKFFVRVSISFANKEDAELNLTIHFVMDSPYCALDHEAMNYLLC